MKRYRMMYAYEVVERLLEEAIYLGHIAAGKKEGPRGISPDTEHAARELIHDLTRQYDDWLAKGGEPDTS